MRVFLTGGSGLVGRGLIKAIKDEGGTCVVVSRNREAALQNISHIDSAVEIIEGDISKEGSWMDAVDGCDAVVNLAGEPVVQRWSQAAKDRIYNSRVQSTKIIVKAMGKAKQKPRVFCSASAIGYYGFNEADQQAFDESAAPGSDFLAQLCVDWEKAAEEAAQLDIRTCIVRIGIVLHPSGGVLARMLPIFRSGLGGMLGNGEQWMSWIHRDDLSRIFCELMTHENAKGIFNGTSPAPCKNGTFSETLARTVRKPSKFSVPKFAMKLLYREGAQVILEGQRVIPNRTVSELDFEYKFPTLQSAMNDLVKLS